jgi:hypothetical protein
VGYRLTHQRLAAFGYRNVFDNYLLARNFPA